MKCEVGATIGGIVLDSVSEPAGRFDGHREHDGLAVLVTRAATPRAIEREALDALELDGVPHVAPRLDTFIVEDAFPKFVLMVEERPDGTPLSSVAAPISRGAAHALAGTLVNVALAAEQDGLVVGGFRPELIYVDSSFQLTGLAPRGGRFVALGAPRSHWQAPPFRDCYEPVGSGSLAPPPSTDVFMIAGTLHYLLTGRPPFAGDNWAVQHHSAIECTTALLLESGLPEVVAAALSSIASERPSLEALAESLGSA